jgi:Predicted Zn-dependent protease
MYIDYYYILILPALFVALWAQIKVSSTFKKYSSVPVISQMTGAQAARNILDANGLHGIRVEHVNGSLTDHYDPKNQVIRLSDKVYAATSIAALGVAAHEAGHALQYAQSYAPIKVRSAIIPVTQIGSYASMPLIFLGLALSSQTLAVVGVLLFASVVLFQVVTLPVEFDASKRAIATLGSSGYLTVDEINGAKKVLDAAAFTYVAALFTAIMNLLRMVLIVSGNRRRN